MKRLPTIRFKKVCDGRYRTEYKGVVIESIRCLDYWVAVFVSEELNAALRVKGKTRIEATIRATQHNWFPGAA